MTIINLEYKMPTVAQARIRLDQAFRTARSQKQPVLKLIHGYGSTGKGGAIKKDVNIFLKEQKFQGKIKYFVSGEDFSPFNPIVREMLVEYPELKYDDDYARENRGVTIVVMK